MRISIIALCLWMIEASPMMLHPLFLPSKGFAQSFGAAYDSPRSIALGRSAIADTRDEWSPNAAIVADSSPHIRAILAPLPTGLPGSWTAGFSGDYPLDGDILAGASFSRYQYTDGVSSTMLFSWQSLGLQASKTFDVGSTRHATAGVRFRYSQETFGEEYLPLDDIAADLGATFDLLAPSADGTSVLTFGAVVTHLLSLYNNQDVQSEDRTAWLGMAYRPLSELTIDVALESSPGFSAAFHAGAEYAVDRHVFVRAGAETATGEISGGVGVNTGNLVADFAAVRHPDLGTSISFGIGFAL